MNTKIYALEGIVHAGKTTLLNNIRITNWDIVCVDEYTLYRGTMPFPDFPATLEEALAANQFFIELDARRFTDIGTSKIVLLDRSCISVIAYHYATEQITHGEIACFKPSLRLYKEQFGRYIPNVMIYLEISLRDLIKRHEGDTGVYKPVLLEEEFNRYLMYFYENIRSFFPTLEVYKIEGTLSKEEVLKSAVEILGFAKQ